MRLSLDDVTLRIELRGWEKLLAFHWHALEVPLTHIEQATTQRSKTTWREIRVPGTFVPWLIKAGTYRWSSRKDFWYVTRGKPHLSIELRQGYFTSITLGVQDNEEWAKRINERIASL